MIKAVTNRSSMMADKSKKPLQVCSIEGFVSNYELKLIDVFCFRCLQDASFDRSVKVARPASGRLRYAVSLPSPHLRSVTERSHSNARRLADENKKSVFFPFLRPLPFGAGLVF